MNASDKEINQEEKRKEWLANLKVGDSVCITNLYNSKLDSMVTKIIYGSDVVEASKVCIITILRAIMPDGCFVVDNDIFDQQGILITKRNDVELPKLCEVTSELETICWRLKFIEQVKILDWNSIDDQGIQETIAAINGSVERMHKKEKEEEECKKREEEAVKQAAEKAKANTNAVKYNNTGVSIANVSLVSDKKVGMLIKPEDAQEYRDSIVKAVIKEIENKYDLIEKKVEDNRNE